MGKGFGRGAKTVGVVTHAQANKVAKKIPRGLKGTNRKARRAQIQRDQEAEEPDTMLETKAAKYEVVSSRKKLDLQIAAVQFKDLVAGKGRRLKHLRKEIVKSVKDIRRRHHEKQTKARKDLEPAMAAAYKADRDKHNKSR